MNSLSRFAELAQPLPIFTPALGYTYYSPMAIKPTAAPSLSATQSSRESSVAPLSQTNTAALESGSLAQTTTSTAAQAPDPRDSYALFESFQMMMRYGDEYMDQNPLRGEPGNFTFSATKERIRAKAAEAEAAKVKAAELARKLEESRTAAAAAPPFVTPFSAPATNGKIKAELMSIDGKPKVKNKERRKSRKSKTATSPTSPMTPAPPATPAS